MRKAIHICFCHMGVSPEVKEGVYITEKEENVDGGDLSLSNQVQKFVAFWDSMFMAGMQLQTMTLLQPRYRQIKIVKEMRSKDGKGEEQEEDVREGKEEEKFGCQLPLLVGLFRPLGS